MYFETYVICKDIYIGDEIADPCEIIVTGNGGLCKIPHFDVVGADLYCCIPLMQAGFIKDDLYMPAAKNTLTLEERKIINEVMGRISNENDPLDRRTNWQVACCTWDHIDPQNEPKIEELFDYSDPKNMPNYAAKNVYFVDNGLYSRIYDDGDYKFRAGVQ